MATLLVSKSPREDLATLLGYKARKREHRVYVLKRPSAAFKEGVAALGLPTAPAGEPRGGLDA